MYIFVSYVYRIETLSKNRIIFHDAIIIVIIRPIATTTSTTAIRKNMRMKTKIRYKIDEPLQYFKETKCIEVFVYSSHIGYIGYSKNIHLICLEGKLFFVFKL